MSRKLALNLEDTLHIAGGDEDPVLEYTVRWQDGAGNTYSTTCAN